MLHVQGYKPTASKPANLQAPTNAPPYDHTEAASNSTLAPELHHAATVQQCRRCKLWYLHRKSVIVMEQRFDYSLFLRNGDGIIKQIKQQQLIINPCINFCFVESQARSGWWPVRLAGRAESRQTTGAGWTTGTHGERRPVAGGLRRRDEQEPGSPVAR